ncbi:MAG: SIS domain-containing protein [Waddliaceae bacterium]
MKREVLRSIKDCILAVEQLSRPDNVSFLVDTAMMLARCFEKGNKVIIAGNGGSLCDASHFSEELTGFFREKRAALPAIALSDPGHITCTANDLGFEWVFARGIEAYGQSGDVFIGLTTSGQSPNIINAVEAAQRLNLNTIVFLGKGGGELKGVADLELIIEDVQTSDRIQEAHMAAIHIIIEMVELLLFSSQQDSHAKEHSQQKELPSAI